MVEKTLLQQGLATPLSGQTFKAHGVVISESLPRTKVNIRADFDNESTASVLGSVTGHCAALSANTFAQNDRCTMYWLGPNERLLYSAKESAANWVKSFRADFPAGRSAVVDVSDYYTVIQVSGENARKVLSSGTPFDLHPREFAVGQCAQTRFGNASVLLSMHESAPVYDLQVRWSFAEYVWGYLCRVAHYS